MGCLGTITYTPCMNLQVYHQYYGRQEGMEAMWAQRFSALSQGPLVFAK